MRRFSTSEVSSPVDAERTLIEVQPAQGILLRPSDSWRIPLGSVVLCVMVLVEFLLVVEAPARGGRAANWTAPAVFGVLLLISCVVIPGYYVRDARRRRRETYRITESRVIVETAGEPTIRSLDIATIDRIAVFDASGDRASIRFIARSLEGDGAALKSDPTLVLPPSNHAPVVIERDLVFDLVDDPDSIIETVVELHDAEAVRLDDFLSATPELDPIAAWQEFSVVGHLVEPHGDQRRLCIVDFAGSRLREMIRIYEANADLLPLHRTLLAALIMASAERWLRNGDSFPEREFFDFLDRRASEFPTVARFWTERLTAEFPFFAPG